MPSGEAAFQPMLADEVAVITLYPYSSHMSWSHGLLRAWIVVTVLWIGFCGYRLVADWPVLGKFVIVIDRAAPFNSDSTRTTIPPDMLAKAREQAATRHKQNVRAHILRIAMQAILQPAALLASGVIVLLIARRVRQS